MAMENHKEKSLDSFYGLSNEEKEFIMECVSHFHYRNGVQYDDGSLGTIKISSKQLRDLLAYAICEHCQQGEAN
jgi:hypothetical protein